MKMAFKGADEKSIYHSETNRITGYLVFFNPCPMKIYDNEFLKLFNKTDFAYENGYVIITNIIKDVCGDMDYIVINKLDLKNGYCRIRFLVKFKDTIKKCYLHAIRNKINHLWDLLKTEAHEMVARVEFEYRDMDFAVGEECINFPTNMPVIYGNITTDDIIKMVYKYIKAYIGGHEEFPSFIND